MSKPVLLTVDDDPSVSRAVSRDLRRHYAEGYRVVRAESGEQALDALREIKRRGERTAALLADHRMPGMTGVEFLEQAMDLFPLAKRILLTAYADTDVAIRAINSVDLDHYLLKPWDPPEQSLYPILDDLLDDWAAGDEPEFEGVRVVGHRWSAGSHEVKDFLARNFVPYRWLDADDDGEAGRLLAAAGASSDRLPVVFPGDGAAMIEPSTREIADRIGLSTTAERPFYDLVVVGGGPAGLGAAVYGASEGLRTVLVEREAAGGQAGQSSRIENYLGFPRGISGSDLARRAATQARRFEAEMLLVSEVTGIEVAGSARSVKLADGGELAAHAVVVATGVSYSRLPAGGVDDFTGRGVYYGAASSEGVSCRDQDVYIVGGANSAGQAAVYFAKFARTVTLLVRGQDLTASMSRYLIDQIARIPTIEVRPCTEVIGARGAQVYGASGADHLETLDLRSSTTGEVETVKANWLFVLIGAAPRTDWLGDAVRRDRRGFVLTGPDLIIDGHRPRGWELDRDPYYLESSVPGIFVAGDVRAGSVKRVASGVGEGAMAVTLVHRYLEMA